MDKVIELFKMVGGKHDVRAIGGPFGNYTAQATHLSRGVLEELFKRNEGGANVFWRPLDHSFVFIDLDRFKGDIEDVWDSGPWMIVKTSQKNWQAWYYFPDIKDREHYREVAEMLTKQFGGDMSSARGDQVGRMPYTKNTKPGRGGFKTYVAKFDDGMPEHWISMVKKAKEPECCEGEDEDEIIDDPVDVESEYEDDGENEEEESMLSDYRDYAQARQIVESGGRRSDVVRHLTQTSARGRDRRYINHTADSAVRGRS
jgi:hypothetical protein